MHEPRFLQIHYLTPYTGVLINRDDTGLAKRLPFGGTMRTRISSQCLKRHWRVADDPHALKFIDGFQDSFRSREIVNRKIFGAWSKVENEAVIQVLKDSFVKIIYGDKAKADDKKTRQTLLLGEKEIDFLSDAAQMLANDSDGDKKQAEKLVKEWIGEKSNKKKKKNIY